MGLSKLSKRCHECPFADSCENKCLEALAYLPEPLMEKATASLTTPLTAEILATHDYRHIKVAEGMTLTIDMEELKERMNRDVYKHLYAGLTMGG